MTSNVLEHAIECLGIEPPHSPDDPHCRLCKQAHEAGIYELLGDVPALKPKPPSPYRFVPKRILGTLAALTYLVIAGYLGVLLAASDPTTPAAVGAVMAVPVAIVCGFVSLVFSVFAIDVLCNWWAWMTDCYYDESSTKHWYGEFTKTP